MGIWEKPAEQFLAKLDEVFEFKAPREHGLDAVEAIHAMAVSKLKVFIGLGGNFISATPDSKITGEAMQNCDLTVQISTKLNRGHLVTGKEALILPCISRSEEDIQKSGQQFVTVENSMGVVHMSKGTLEPASNKLKSEPAIVAGIAAATLNVAKPNWNELSNDYDLIRDYIEATISGFDDYNKRVRNPSGFYLPNGARDGEFNTANGKANFTVNEIPNRAISANNFIMMTIRTHDQYNTTIYGLNDRYRGIENERRVVLMNKEDLKSQGLKPEQIVNLKSHFKGEVRQANNFKVLEYDIPVGCVATYFPETNVLVPLNNVAKVSNTPASKFIEVSVEKV